ncbi:hypothetical protein K470DRAFT_277212 [Piedraia hortae CBS 480.64]|uniref:Calcium uniporter protein n=1 Tax=Piedraia hortae CBS 480.64 TaxID=1314780 RepID=A0A6A7BZF8_9PEZI|nr:hypothetical protein K470DRAFT_277212 [Piedraia hortae CBS 480.64]
MKLLVGALSSRSASLLSVSGRAFPHRLHIQRHEFSATAPSRIRARYDAYIKQRVTDSDSQPASKQSQHISQAEKDHFDKIEHDSKLQQQRAPWAREGSDVSPADKIKQKGTMTKGKLLTTPSRMLKLILPLTPREVSASRKDVEPLALLVHPQQPLSYLERLIQSELPPLETEGRDRYPNITFRAQNVSNHANAGMEDKDGSTADDDGKTSSDDPHANFVRWSPSTEIGDFIRDASQGKEFEVNIEGASRPIYVGVPSFEDRTYYLRMRLRKIAGQIREKAGLKERLDAMAHRSAQRVAQAGFGGLISWWGVVYYLTFKTELGWDVMEPVTYLVGLSGLIGGYMWFLYHNREVSYQSAMHFTVSRRQHQLYQQHGLNLAQWEMLVEEGNKLRREIKMVADEYDVDWDESQDEGDDSVKKALREAREQQEKKHQEKEGEDRVQEQD